jgi:MAP/microtubule affinity-regulating kinase
LLSAIEYCHNLKIVHRDLKFQNILLARKPDIKKAAEGGGSPSKLNKNEFDLDLRIVDFGIFGSTSGMNPEKIQAGSLKYMAPELLKGHTESNPAIDVWSLGIILHGIVLGFLPFRASKKEELRKMIIESPVNLNQKGISF